MSSWFKKGLASATSWLDTTFNTGGYISSAATAAYTYGGDIYDKYIKDSFLEDVAVDFSKSVVTGAVLGGQTPQGTPMPVQKGVSAAPSSVNTNLGKAGQVRAYTGTNNPRVQEAYRKLNQSNNPSIQSALNVVRPNIARRGPTKTLQEAKIERRKS